MERMIETQQRRRVIKGRQVAATSCAAKCYRRLSETDNGDGGGGDCWVGGVRSVLGCVEKTLESGSQAPR